MNFNTDALSLLTLGIRDDAPVGTPPALPDGVHLRWFSDPDLGFPWHGYYLFRRESRPSRPRCLAKELRRFRPGPLQSTRLETTLGRLSSAKALVFTDDFPVSGLVEVDLASGVRFDLPAGVEARRVDVRIGLRDTGPQTTLTCADFRRFPLGLGPSPRTEKGAIFETEPPPFSPHVAVTSIEQWGDARGLQCTRKLEIALPCAASRVDLRLTNRGDLRIEALLADGTRAGREIPRLTLNSGIVTLTGKGIVRVTIESATTDPALLHEICWECPAADPPGRQVFADFKSWTLGERPNPVTEQGVRFEVRDERGKPLPFASFEKRAQVWTGLRARHQVEIQLPCPTTEVTMQFSRGSSDPAVHVQAFNQDGTLAQSLEMHVGLFGAEAAILKGAAITRLLVDAPGPDALLHHVVFHCAATRTAEIEVRALAGAAVVARTIVQGNVGEVVAASLEGTGITAVEIAAGPAALVDLCFLISKQPETFGWDELKGFTYPLCLPVAHADYPCPSKPPDFDKAQALAFSRVTYRAPLGWDSDSGFHDLHDQLEILVKGGPGGGPMADRINPDLPGQPLSPATQSDVPNIPAGLHPLELILLGSLQPAVAQMIGTYFVDTTAAANVPYDYLLLADPSGVLGGSAESALEWLAFTTDHTKVDGVLTLDRKVTTHPTIAPPGEGRAYALPGPATRGIDGSLPVSAGNVGIWWPLPADSTTEEQPDRIVFYYPHRVSHGPLEPSAPPADAAYLPLRDGAPFLVSEPEPTTPPTAPNPRSPDWPPPTIPIHLVDGSLAEGWYSYRLTGQDLFGRRSGLGPPARWYEWTPTSERHAFAVALLDKVSPPIPLAAEAWALDPPDRWVLADEAYTTWRDDNPDLVGLRVRWRWTFLQQIQAPDTREFRIYYQPGRWNALLGRIVKVVAASLVTSDVDLDFADPHPPGKFTGARLRVGNDDFEILNSQPGAPLRLRVKNVGVKDEIPPAEGKPCTVAIPEAHTLWVDTGLAKTWAKRLAVVPYDPPLRTVFDPSKDRNGQPLTSANVVFKTIHPVVTGADVYFPPVPVVNPPTPDSPQNPNLSDLQPWIDHLWLQGTGNAKEAHPIVRYNATARTVTLKAAVTLVGSPVAWILGRPTREYEIFLPAPEVGNGFPFEPSFAEPAVYAQIAVSAADDKIHTKDDPKWNDPDRYGNESRLSPSATVFRVLQKKPDPPELVEKFGRIFATPADYHSRSYFTFRFVPKEHLKVHVLRALDESLFRRDQLIRETRKKLDPVPDPPPPGTPPSDPPPPPVKREHLDYFPDGPLWDFAKRAAAAEELNKIGKVADYDALAPDTWKVLALLPGNEGASADAKTEDEEKEALKKRDWLLRRTRSSLAKEDTDFFPKSWTPATREAVAGEFKQFSAPDGYLKLSDEALRVLSTLPGNEAAFTQVTLDPLDMADPKLHDERRPDDEPLYAPDPTLRRAYTDTLPGRATNRYFYRARFVDGAQNQSGLSGPTAPVYLPKVEPPRAPVITKVLGGDRQITIYWAANREQDLAEYQLYEADNEQAARDLRTMALIATLPEAIRDPAARAAETSHQRQVIAGSVLFYRLVAVDSSNLVSSPSPPVPGMAYEGTAPAPPEWEEVVYDAARSQLRLRWRTHYPQTCLVMRYDEDGLRFPMTQWLAGTPAPFGVWLFDVTVQAPDPGRSSFEVSGRTSGGFSTRSLRHRPQE